VKALAQAAQAQLADLRDDPAATPAEAVAGSREPALQDQLGKVQSSLKASLDAATVDAQRADEAVSGFAPEETDLSKLKAAADRLSQLLADATQAKQKAEQAHANFLAARDTIAAATSAG